MSARTATDETGVLAFMESVELAAVEAYESISANALIDEPDLLAALDGCASHHREHAQGFGELAGDEAGGEANAGLVELLELRIDAAASAADLVRVAFDLENALVATHLWVLGEVTSDDTVGLAASALPEEAGHAVTHGRYLGLSLAELVPAFETTDAAATPERYPVGD